MTRRSVRGRFPDCVPTLVDPGTGVTLRAHGEADLAAIVEQARDPESKLWTTVPTPPGGYSLEDAREFALAAVPAGWVSGTALSWAVEALVDGDRRFCGSISLRREENGTADVAFGLHPAARGRSVMSTALRLLRDYAFDVCRLVALRWRSRVGNWDARRVVAAAGFRFDGTVRKLMLHRGQLVDTWWATITAADPRRAVPWLDAPTLGTDRLTLRQFRNGDVAAIVEACADPRTQHWLASLPVPYGAGDARSFLHAVREMSARCLGMNWCVADATSDRCVGSISLEGFGGYSRRTEIGYWLHPGVRGRGYMTEALTLVTGYAESNRLTDSILIRCAATNAASRHVAARAGYQPIGVLPRSEPLRDGTVVDLVLYSRP
jgi:ribosomal-protein-alanine N-acetyltransferase